MTVTIVGGGLAGSEAAWQLAKRNVKVRLVEMKPGRFSPAHKSEGLAELVCSNSLRAASLTSAAGLLKAELRVMDSLIMRAADATAVPAGKALAVDRDLFARFITDALTVHPLVEIIREEMTAIDQMLGPTIIATGPLTSDALAGEIVRVTGSGSLSFYDAIAPIVTAESLDMNRLFRASRYGEPEEEGDYLNAPMDESTYRSFVQAIMEAEKVEPHPFEQVPHFEGCLPVEELARRGPQTLAFGPMKPVGLVDPKTGKRPFAVVQLRAENREQTLFNLVGFQTKMTYPEQDRVFRLIPGLENCVFVRLGSVHRNTYLDSPRLLTKRSRLRDMENIFFAGQITGVEGYIESTASGLVVGILAGLVSSGANPEPPPASTAMGALIRHTTTVPPKRFEPMNINFGIMDPPPPGTPKKARKEVMAKRGLEAIVGWKEQIDGLWAEGTGH